MSTRRLYIGSTDHLLRRFTQHRSGYSKATKNRGPWWMPYYEIHPSLASARAREFELKSKKSAERIRRIMRRTLPGVELL